MFFHESTMKAVQQQSQVWFGKNKWKDIYDNMERIYDMCEDVADALEGLAVKNR